MDDIIDDTGSTVGGEGSPRQRLDALCSHLGELFGADFSDCTSDAVAVNVAGLLRLERQRAENTVRLLDEAGAGAERRRTALEQLVNGLESGFGITVDDTANVFDILFALAATRDEAQDRIEAAHRDAREAEKRADDVKRRADRDQGDAYGLGREAGRIAGRAEILDLVDAARSRALDAYGITRRGMVYLIGALDAIADLHSTGQGAV